MLTEEEKSARSENSEDRTEPVKPAKKIPRVYFGKDVQRKLIELMIDEEPGILAMKVKVNPKVLGLLGDEKLESAAMKHVDKSKVNRKVIATLGASCMMPDKALKRLGDEDMSNDQRRAMRLAQESEEEAKERAKREQVKRIVNEKVHKEQQIIRSATRINAKAIDALGGTEEEALMSQVRTLKTSDMQVNKKTVALMGEASLVSNKVAQRRGSEMHVDQRQRMLAAQAKEERQRQKDLEAQRKAALSSGPTVAQLTVSDEVKKKANKKILEMTGTTAVLPDKLKGMLGEEMTPEQRHKMLDAENKGKDH